MNVRVGITWASLSVTAQSHSPHIFWAALCFVLSLPALLLQGMHAWGVTLVTVDAEGQPCMVTHVASHALETRGTRTLHSCILSIFGLKDPCSRPDLVLATSPLLLRVGGCVGRWVACIWEKSASFDYALCLHVSLLREGSFFIFSCKPIFRSMCASFSLEYISLWPNRVYFRCFRKVGDSYRHMRELGHAFISDFIVRVSHAMQIERSCILPPRHASQTLGRVWPCHNMGCHAMCCRYGC